jgi:hypothetical protein
MEYERNDKEKEDTFTSDTIKDVCSNDTCVTINNTNDWLKKE